MKKVILSLLVVSILSCATVTDSVVSAINQEQYDQLNYIYILLQDFRHYSNKESLNMAENELNSIPLDEIYNSDYRSKVIGLNALLHLYKGDRSLAKSNIKKVHKDEELYWIVTSLLEKKSEVKLELLVNAKANLHESDKIDDFLADLYMENQMYGEAAAAYDKILLTEEYYQKEYKNKRDLAYLFMKTPPTNKKSGMIVSKEVVLIQDLIELIEIETTYFSSLAKRELYKSLQDKNFFYNNQVESGDKVQRKDLAYFLFALIADRSKNLGLWARYKEFFDPDISESEKKEVENRSPIQDTPIYEYYFYPTLYLIEEEIMELPDGENFFPNNNVSGLELHSTISNLKERLD